MPSHDRYSLDPDIPCFVARALDSSLHRQPQDFDELLCATIANTTPVRAPRISDDGPAPEAAPGQIDPLGHVSSPLLNKYANQSSSHIAKALDMF